MDTTLRLHIGGRQVKRGWKILNIQPAEGVDFVGDAADLSQIDDEMFDEVYASHVIEHLGHREEPPAALKGICRILKPGGVLRLSVPDLDVLCKLFVREDLDINAKFSVMRIMFGGQSDDYDFHKVGLTWDFLRYFLSVAGFRTLTKVADFGIFDDFSSYKCGGVPISLNVVAEK